MRHLTPKIIVHELDKYIIGQQAAKKAVAIAIRNRWRRQQLADELRAEVTPKNIILIGPTGVGKTEISRRIAKLIGAPFVKVEASKFTEVGYVGRDVESMIRDLAEAAVNLVNGEHLDRVRAQAREAALDQVLDLLVRAGQGGDGVAESRRAHLRQKIAKGELDEFEVEVSVAERAQAVANIFGSQGYEHMGFDIQGLFDKMMPKREKKLRKKVRDALPLLEQQHAEALLDQDKIQREAMERAQNTGIVFLDEIDKIAAVGADGRHGPDVSREGVQRDLLPVVEGSTVATKYGPLCTDHVLFIAAGAFHRAKPSDLIAELQGRFPIRVELDALGRDDFLRILREPRNALTRQYRELLATEQVRLEFTDDSLERLAALAEKVNESTVNIGARRLHTIFEKLLEEPLFHAPDQAGETITIDCAFVEAALGALLKDQDLARYIL